MPTRYPAIFKVVPTRHLPLFKVVPTGYLPLFKVVPTGYFALFKVVPTGYLAIFKTGVGVFCNSFGGVILSFVVRRDGWAPRATRSGERLIVAPRWSGWAPHYNFGDQLDLRKF